MQTMRVCTALNAPELSLLLERYVRQRALVEALAR